MKAFLGIILSFLTLGLVAVTPDVPRTPAVVKFSQHQFVKQGHAKAIAGGASALDLVVGFVCGVARTIQAIVDLPLRLGGMGRMALRGGYLVNPGELVTPDGVQVTNMARMRPILAANADPVAANATLRHEEWQRVDERVNRVFRERLTVAEDLRSRGLVTPVSLGTILRKTERLNDFEDAEISFDGDALPEKQKVTYESDVIPVPVISTGFDIGWRQLEASRMRGEPLDVTAAEQAARKVRDKLQALITNGLASGGPTGGGIPGLTTATNRITSSLTYNWDVNQTEILNDIESALAAAYAKSLFGPFVLYVPKNYWATIQGDYSTSKGDRTFMERILAYSDIEAVRPNDALGDDNVLLVQMSGDVIDLSEAQSVTTIQWQKNPFVTHFRVLMVGGPHIKNIETDQNATIAGIVHMS